MKATFWGVRGSLATPEEAMLGVGGNTPCVLVDIPDIHLVLDAGTGIRGLGEKLAAVDRKPIHILLTHLHLDHIQGLLFFLPLFQSGREVVIWGPPSRHGSLKSRLARYLSTPLSPIAIYDLPASVRFEECQGGSWEIGGAKLNTAAVLHRGPTLAFRIRYGGSTLVYMPDHEPALTGSLEKSEPRWLSGAELAIGADVLIHDAQYSDEQYEGTRGWGHSRIGDAVRFSSRLGIPDLRLFHHDPAHDDTTLETFEGHAATYSGDTKVTLAREGETVCLSD